MEKDGYLAAGVVGSGNGVKQHKYIVTLYIQDYTCVIQTIPRYTGYIEKDLTFNFLKDHT